MSSSSTQNPNGHKVSVGGPEVIAATFAALQAGIVLPECLISTRSTRSVEAIQKRWSELGLLGKKQNSIPHKLSWPEI
ncbi:MAG: hypothetical protein AAB960_00605 [Patescibacteria group bacterium]